jgi:two-component system LytT family response regulator
MRRRLLAWLEERRRARETAGEAARPYLVRLAVRQDRRIVLLRVDDIDWIESCANYVRLHTQSGEHLVRMTMTELEQRLDPAQFARIHRTAIVRIDRIKEVVPAWHGDFNVTLKDGTVLRLSRNYRKRLQR